MSVTSFVLNQNDFLKTSYINKFMPLERALDLLKTKSIWFANPESWQDPYEKRFINAKYEGNNSFAWKGRVFCTCFTDNATSEASWNAYAKEQICVQITFKRKALLDMLDAYSNNNPNIDVYFDKVEYMQSKYIEKPLSAIPFNPKITSKDFRSKECKVRMLLLKRKAFEYEQEYRVIIVKSKAIKADGIRVEFLNIDDVIESITIGPTVKEATYAMLKEVLERDYGIKNIKQSYLYKQLPKEILIKYSNDLQRNNRKRIRK